MTYLFDIVVVETLGVEDTVAALPRGRIEESFAAEFGQTSAVDDVGRCQRRQLNMQMNINYNN